MDLNECQKMATEMIKAHGLDYNGINNSLDYLGYQGWHFAFDNAVRRFGCCNYRTKWITLSRKIVLLNDEKAVRSTILHEIAHAIAGPRTGHGPKWRQIALSIGDDGQRCYGNEVNVPVHRFIGTCPRCQSTFKRNARKRYASCGGCNGRHGRSPLHTITWTRNA